MKKITITLRKNEEKVMPLVWIDEKENEIVLEADLAGENATLRVIGIFFGTKNNALTCTMKILHSAKKTKSFTAIRGVFKDKSEFKNDALITIRKGSSGADGYFASKILLFGDAKGRSVPSLEIDENDLKAGHASTVGRPDQEQLFYLQSRGLSEKEATSLIISGFFEPLLKLFPLSEEKEARRRLHVSLASST